MSSLRRSIACIKSRHPHDADTAFIREYLLHLMEARGILASTVHQHINALRNLYADLYKQPIRVKDLGRPRKERKLPVILDKDEVAGIFRAVENLKHRTMPMLVYSAGIRKSLTMHTLRHSFTMHLLESGVDVRCIRELPGHARSKLALSPACGGINFGEGTKEIYTHVSKKSLGRIVSPLDTPMNRRRI